MYIPNKMSMKSIDTIHQFIEDFNFGIIVSNRISNIASDNILVDHQPTLTASHLPFILMREEGHLGTLYCHFAEANPQWTTLNNENLMVIFNGPHSYISPKWYASKPAVPTWNYAAVHIHGVAEYISDEQTINVINQTIEKHEPSLLKQKGKEEIVTEQYKTRLLSGVHAIKVTITQIEGVEKLGQNRSTADQQGIMIGLENSRRSDASALLSYMNKTKIGIGN